MPDDHDTAYGWDIDPEVLTLRADIQEMRTELDTALTQGRELREQVAAGQAREVFLHDQIAQLRTALDRAGLPLPDPGRSPLSLAA